jgi:alkylhydroperoxidase/carboxymuconolactone decarboxylase family protein YurZ
MAQRTWLVTSVNSGFGRELAGQILKQGDRLVGTVRDTRKVADLVERYPQTFQAEIPKEETMSITEMATRNHEKWFPGHTSTLKVSDPEFIELFDNFAFDEVIAHANLHDRTRLMTILAALIAVQAFSEFKVLVGAALNLGVTPVEVKEIV